MLPFDETLPFDQTLPFDETSELEFNPIS